MDGFCARRAGSPIGYGPWATQVAVDAIGLWAKLRIGGVGKPALLARMGRQSIALRGVAVAPNPHWNR